MVDGDNSANGDLRDSDGTPIGESVIATVTTGVSGSNDHTIDFGFYRTGQVTGHLFGDLDGSGNEAPTEPPLPNITLVITDAFGLTRTVQTDSNGDYTTTVPVGTTVVDVLESTLPTRL
ncbi:MAG: hypothetical protein R2932_55435 [Caldilineaceae bacterium]